MAAAALCVTRPDAPRAMTMVLSVPGPSWQPSVLRAVCPLRPRDIRVSPHLQSKGRGGALRSHRK
eukprot:8174434-Prorocentrum_lima.AAC.1